MKPIISDLKKIDLKLKGFEKELEKTKRILGEADELIHIVYIQEHISSLLKEDWQPAYHLKINEECEEDILMDQDLFNYIMPESLEILGTIVENMNGSLCEVIRDFFLFTVLGMFCTERVTCLFSFGDGVYAFNDEVTVLSSRSNKPRYLSYALFWLCR